MQKANNEIEIKTVEIKTFKEFKQKLKEIMQDNPQVKYCLKDNGLYIEVE